MRPSKLFGLFKFLVVLVMTCSAVVRPAQAADAPPPGAITLFNGTVMAHWVRSAGGAPGWSTTNGVLTIVPGSGSIRTFEAFEDFELHLEFRFNSTSPPGTAEGNLINSGVYLQDQYEIQIMESFNRPLSGANDGGSIWSIRDAAVNASLPGGMWETYDIVFHAVRWTNGTKTASARVSLWWNDVLVHDNVAIPRATDGAAVAETPPPAGIRLQDLVGVVQFRNIWVRPLEPLRAPSAEPITLVPAGAAWRYLDAGSNPGIGWRSLDFDESAWSAGVAEFGYGDGDEKTVVRSNRLDGTRIEASYFRKTFVATNVWAITNLSVGLLRDDGGVVYLNGVEVFRSNVTNANVAFTNWAAGTVNVPEESRFYATNVHPALLAEGTNVIAVEIHQVSSTSSDLSFDLRMTALTYRQPKIRVERDGAVMTMLWPSTPGGFVLEGSASLIGEANWNVVPAAPIVTNGFNAVQVGVPGDAAFFRLRR